MSYLKRKYEALDRSNKDVNIEHIEALRKIETNVHRDAAKDDEISETLTELDTTLANLHKHIDDLEYIRYYHPSVVQARIKTFIDGLKSKELNRPQLRNEPKVYAVDHIALDKLLSEIEIVDLYENIISQRVYKYTTVSVILYKKATRLYKWSCVTKFRNYNPDAACFVKKNMKFTGTNYPVVVKQMFEFGDFPSQIYTTSWHEYNRNYVEEETALKTS